MVPGGQYNSLREVRLSEHRFVDRSINASIESPKMTIDNGSVTPSANAAMLPNVK